jgi:hypothetical protein
MQMLLDTLADLDDAADSLIARLRVCDATRETSETEKTKVAITKLSCKVEHNLRRCEAVVADRKRRNKELMDHALLLMELELWVGEAQARMDAVLKMMLSVKAAREHSHLKKVSNFFGAFTNWAKQPLISYIL